MWETTSVSAVGAFTVNLDLSQYSHILIIATPTVDNLDGKSVVRTVFTVPTVTDESAYPMLTGSSDGNGGEQYKRLLTVTTSGIQFQNGIKGSYYNSNCCVPVRIYGFNASNLDLRPYVS